MLTTIVLGAAALLTSILSGMLGMAGGMLLLATMFCFMSHAEAIPSHAAVQLISNTTRTLAFVEHVDWRTVGRFTVGVVPGATAGACLLWWLGRSVPPESLEAGLKIVVGGYILGSLFFSRGELTMAAESRRGFVALGFAAGAAALTFGAVGPLIAPLFAVRGFSKERLVATKAVCQSLLHVAKIPAFLAIRSYDDLPGLGGLTLTMGLLTIPGTLLGKRLLTYVSERRYQHLYRAALLATGLKVLLIDGLRPALTGA